MKIAVFVALALLLYIFVVIWLVTKVRYHITARHFRISIFGFSLRRIPLTSIDSVTKRRPVGFAENWCNTIHPSHRMLVLKLNRGLRRNLIITPRNRYVFKTEIERAIHNLAPSRNFDSDVSPEETALADESTTSSYKSESR